MKFTETEPDENFPKARFTSETGAWELGLYPTLYGGVRVRAGRANSGGVEIDYCAGKDPIFLAQLLAVVKAALEKYPESVSLRVIKRSFPSFEIKPINLDPTCWTRLQEMAKPEFQPCITCPTCGRTSYNANDIEQKYCAACDRFHEDMPTPPEIQNEMHRS